MTIDNRRVAARIENFALTETAGYSACAQICPWIVLLVVWDDLRPSHSSCWMNSSHRFGSDDDPTVPKLSGMLPPAK
jgi:hypothetical protein